MPHSRSLANVGLFAVAAILLLATRRWESALTIVLPTCVIHWIIARENHVRPPEAKVRWKVRLVSFLVPVGLCLGVVLFWFPAHIGSLPLWGAYSIASFSIALVLVKLYERDLRMRKSA